LLVMPPWPHEEHIAADEGSGQWEEVRKSEDPSSLPTAHCSLPADSPTARCPLPTPSNPFRQQHGLTSKFVVMYSGNHSPSNPLTTLLAATVAFRDDPDLRFLFVGGGTGKQIVETHIAHGGSSNTVSLPYQPIETLRHSLSAADMHVVSLGNEMVGIVHPCKIYGAMAAGRPILYLGPRPSHVADLLDAHGFGWVVAHGDVAGCERAIDAMRRTPPEKLAEMGRTARRVLSESLTQRLLCGRFCDALEKALRLKVVPVLSPGSSRL
jgi:colanic acid biosynthesis glycosyl transferase WcaI